MMLSSNQLMFRDNNPNIRWDNSRYNILRRDNNTQWDNILHRANNNLWDSSLPRATLHNRDSTLHRDSTLPRATPHRDSTLPLINTLTNSKATLSTPHRSTQPKAMVNNTGNPIWYTPPKDSQSRLAYSTLLTLVRTTTNRWE